VFLQYRSQGFILQTEIRGEADKILKVFTRKFGKIGVLAKAIRKLDSKLKSQAELFCLAEIEFIQGKSGKTLTDAVVLEKFQNTKNDLSKLRLAANFGQIFCSLVKNGQPDKALWILLTEFSQLLNKEELPGDKAFLFYQFFFWNLLRVLGYGPELYRCLLCSKTIAPPKIYWSNAGGGLVCPSCVSRTAVKTEMLSAETIKVLRLLFRQEWGIVKRVKLSPRMNLELKTISQKYLNLIQ